MFEQAPEVLEQRFGFRVATYGMRWVFPRIPDHPVLAGLGYRALRAGRVEEAAILEPFYLKDFVPRKKNPKTTGMVNA